MSTCSALLHQVFVGKIPRDLYEDELVPLFESAGPIWDLRLMMDPLSGQNRGYAFITYCNKDDAQKAVKLVSSMAGYLEKLKLYDNWNFLNIALFISNITLKKEKKNPASHCFMLYIADHLQCISHSFWPPYFIFSVITMKSALASTWECVYLLQTIACLSDQFQRTRQEKVYWKTLAKLQVSFKSTEVDLCQKPVKTDP